MGRPPNPNGRRSAELGKKYFTVPIPPVDPRVHAAVERYGYCRCCFMLLLLSYIMSLTYIYTLLLYLYYSYSRIASRHPWLVQRAQLDKAESQLLEHRSRQEASLQKVEQLLKSRNLALQEISTLRNSQLQTSLLEMDTRLRTEFQQAQQHEQEQLQQECEALLSRSVPSEEDEEPPTKRMKVDSNTNEQEEKQVVESNPNQSTTTVDTASTSSNVANTTEASATAKEEEPKPSQLKRKQLEVCLYFSS